MEKINWERLVQKLIWWQWVITVMGIVTIGSFWLVMAKNLPPQIPLFYSLPWGEDQLTSSIYLTLPIGISILVVVFVWIIATKTKIDRVLASILTGAGLVSELILFLAVVRIMLLVS